MEAKIFFFKQHPPLPLFFGGGGGLRRDSALFSFIKTCLFWLLLLDDGISFLFFFFFFLKLRKRASLGSSYITDKWEIPGQPTNPGTGQRKFPAIWAIARVCIGIENLTYMNRACHIYLYVMNIKGKEERKQLEEGQSFFA